MYAQWMIKVNTSQLISGCEARMDVDYSFRALIICIMYV